MTLDLDDTIAAIATAPGGSVRGIVRISGPRCVPLVEQIVQRTAQPVPRSGVAASCDCGTLQLPRELGRIPVTLYVWPTIRSYTRQPSAELHLLGSPPLLEAALDAVCQAGARLAQPGEFTLRSFLGGRLDLTQAEAVLGVIDAKSPSELNQALVQLAGGMARPLVALREQLLDLLAQLEAGLDFVDEGIEFISRQELQRQLVAAAQRISELADQMRSRGEAGQRPTVALVGVPNAGKSSLLNSLAGTAAAIVSEIAGTTRDPVTRQIIVGGRECVLADTAGSTAEMAQSQVDAAAQRATDDHMKHADVTLLCIDRSRPLSLWETNQLNQTAERRLIVLTKCDLPPSAELPANVIAIQTSSVAGSGLDELRRAIAEALDVLRSEAGTVASTADRCGESLRLAGEALQRACAISPASGEELIAAEIHVALDELGRVSGAVYTDDILDRVFSRFCIGK